MIELNTAFSLLEQAARVIGEYGDSLISRSMKDEGLPLLDLEREIRSFLEVHDPSGGAPAAPDEQDLQLWFGLGRCSFATLPRVIMEAMPPAWQAAMGKLLLEYDQAYVNRPDIDVVLVAKRDGKFIKMPEWVTNYRHPDPAVIKHALGKEWQS